MTAAVRCTGCRWARRCVNGPYCTLAAMYVPAAVRGRMCTAYEASAAYAPPGPGGGQGKDNIKSSDNDYGNDNTDTEQSTDRLPW